MIITKDNKMFQSTEFQQDKYKFHTIIKSLESPTLELYSDEINYIICRAKPEKPVWIWTKDNFNYSCIREIEELMTEMLNEPPETKFTCKEELYHLLKKDLYPYLNTDYFEMGFLICHQTKQPKYCDGQLCTATEEHKELLARYWYYDLLESQKTDAISLKESTEYVERILKETTIYMWKNSNDDITTIAYYQVKDNQAKISNVYTHPEYRRQRYASNLIYQITNEILSKGYIPLLYTNYNYIPSNKTYMNVGYEPLGKLINFSCTKK